MLRRTRRTLWIVAAVLLVLAVAIFLRFKAPPEAARLLPESDGIFYLNLGQIRAFTHPRPLTYTPDYQAFLNAIGADPERDLDEAAIALHRMDDPRGPNGPVAYSLVLVGKVDGKSLARYLEAHSVAKEVYAGHTVFSAMSEGRTVRIAQIAYDTVAVSNFPGPEKIHSMLDRHRTAALPFAGSSLLAEHYSEIPLLSLAWGIGQIGLPLTESGKIHLFGMGLPLEPDTTFLASVHWAGALKLRVEEIAPTEAVAGSQTASLNLLLNLTRGATAGLADNATNKSLKELLRSAEVVQKRNRVVASASLPGPLLSSLEQNGGSDQP